MIETINMLCYLFYNRNTLEEVERYIDKSIHSYDSFIGYLLMMTMIKMGMMTMMMLMMIIIIEIILML
jgi:hypothetical protein